MTDTAALGSLFAREPERCGFRGDPHLWRELGEHFAHTPMPNSWFDVNRLLAEGFGELTGTTLDECGPEAVPIARYKIGSGMSDGTVNRKWWATIGEAILVDRWSAWRASRLADGGDVAYGGR